MKKVKKVDEDLLLKQNDDLTNRLKTYFSFFTVIFMFNKTGPY